VVVGGAAYQNGESYTGQTDTYINGYYDQQSTHFGGRAEIHVKSDRMVEGLLQFDLAGRIPAGAFVASARLKVFGYGQKLRTAVDRLSAKMGDYFVPQPPAFTLRAFPLNREFDPGGATWLQAADGNPWEAPGATGGSERGPVLDQISLTAARAGWLAFDVTPALREVVNNAGSRFGLLLDSTSSAIVEYALASGTHAADAAHGNVAPVLEVVYLTKPPDILLNVVATNDLHGALTPSTQKWSHGDPVGGLQWLAGYYNILRRQNPGGVVALDAGDMMQGTLESNYFYGESVVAGFNALGLKGATLGNHEFDWGIPKLVERMQQSNFPWVACNIRLKDTGERPSWVRPYTYLFAKGVKIGLIGVANPTTGQMTNPEYTGDLRFTDPATEVNGIIDEVIAGGATVVIVDAHIGGFSPDYADIAALANALDPEKVDVILSGHTHSSIAAIINGIPVVQSYSGGTAFGRVDLTIDPWSMMVSSFTVKDPQNVYDTWYGEPARYEGRTVAADPAVAAAIQPYLDQVETLKATVIGSTTAPLTTSSRFESPMGDLITDAWRTLGGVDFALTNSGGIRAELARGDITYGELFAVQPFGNTLVKVQVTGAQLRSTLEDGITGAHGLVQVSGLKFKFNYNQPAHSRILGDVIDLRTNRPIDPAATYTIVVNSFMASGGDEYTLLPECPQVDTYIVDIDFLSNYVRTHSPLTAPVMGRITALGTPPAN
jgi:2',3'-cyclic-nucleotide 2'-phosphodiesterase (5'-nucleotidase family)